MSEDTDLRVVICDDQALVRAGFRVLIDTTPGLRVVGEAGTGSEAVDVIRRTRPDVALMDIQMPELDGIEATRRLLGGEDPLPVRILILTTFDLDRYVFTALHAGASGFLLKDTPPGDLLAAISVIADGEALLSPRITRKLVAEFARRPGSPSRPPPASPTSPTANAKSSPSWPAACPTPRSPTPSTSPTPPPSSTSADCSPNSPPATAPNWSSPPTRAG